MTIRAIINATHCCRHARRVLSCLTFAGIVCFVAAASRAQDVAIGDANQPPDSRLPVDQGTRGLSMNSDPLPPPDESPAIDFRDHAAGVSAPARFSPPSEGPNPQMEPGTGGGGISASVNRFHYSLGLRIRGVYDDNIFISSVDRIDDYYFEIEPTITLGFGDAGGDQSNHIQFVYQPSIFLFVDHTDENAVNHVIRLDGYHRFSRLALTLDQDIELLDSAHLDNSTSGLSNVGIVDAGGRNEVDRYTTTLGATYDLTGKTFLSGGLGYSRYDYPEGLNSSAYLSGNVFVNYNYSPKLVIGLGGTGGYNWVESPSPNETFEQVNLRASYQVTGKISMTASGGVEFRQFENDSRGTYISPVYNLSASYQPFDGTTITLSGNASVQNSASLSGQDYLTTTINGSVRQRLFGRAYLSVTAGYESAEYFSAVNGINGTRTDNYYFVQPAVDLTVARWWTAGAYYLHREDDSSTANFSFYDNQIGLRSEFTF